MTEHRSGCLVCSEELLYLDETRKLNCHYCNEVFDADAMCVDGHHVCDRCHSLSANDVILKTCINTQERDPVKLAVELMRNHAVNMHGPEHHYLVPAVLLTCYYNALGDPESKGKGLRKARGRAEKVSGGFCGFQGCCGAGVGTGIFFSVMTGATPYSVEEWGSAMEMTAKALTSIASHGGPRCCKRTTFLAILEAVSHLDTVQGVSLPVSEDVKCEFSPWNRECQKGECPFYEG